MCGRFELKTKFENLPKILKQDYPTGLHSKYETQNLIRPNAPKALNSPYIKIINVWKI